MFFATSKWRCRVIAYAPSIEFPRIHIRYAHGGIEREDADYLEFEDFEMCDLFLAELDSGKLFLIDRAKIRGLK